MTREERNETVVKKIVVVSDSFKGSLSSMQISHIVDEEARKLFPACNVVGIPVADGGEGTVDCFLACLEGERVNLTVSGPYFEPVEGFYGRFGTTAVIEMAAAAGLPLVGERKNPTETTTFGVGELMKHALEHGAREVILALGGSATNDGGCGCAAAMGTKFFDAAGKTFVPTGGTLSRIARIDCSETNRILEGVRVTAMCDIDNPMHGPTGAAYIFGPQKGADAETVKILDRELAAFDECLERELGAKVASVPGAGAAGAMGAGVLAFFGAELKRGIEAVLDAVGFEQKIQDADFVITGEGKIDGQSLRGKVVSGVSRRAKKFHVPVLAVVGDVGDDIGSVYDMGVTAVFSTNQQAIPFSEAKKRSENDYRFTVQNLFRLIFEAQNWKN